MDRNAPDDRSLIFGDFIELLRRQGFAIGIDHYIRLQELLAKAGAQCPPFDLKTLLCPIFATSRAQQELFYRTFESYFAIFSVKNLAEEEAIAAEAGMRAGEGRQGSAQGLSPREKPRPLRPLAYVLAGIWATAVIAGVSLWMASRPAADKPAVPVERAEAPVEAPPQQEQPTKAPSSPSQASAPAAHGDGIRAGAPPTPYPIGLLLLLALGTSCLIGVYAWRRLGRRQLVVQKSRGYKPPYTWPIRVEGAAPRLWEPDSFFALARSLRRRQADEFSELDVGATVSATIDALGYPTFRYRAATRQPEYLALIHRSSFRDHQARLFDTLVKDLEHEGVLVASCYYDADPRICARERGAGIPLSDLKNLHRSHRLLIFGDGEQLIDPLTGRLAAWVADSLEWPERAVLTPVPPKQWGWREINLAGRFLVLPASVEGIHALIDHFEARSLPELRDWRRQSREAAAPSLDGADVIAGLRGYLGEETFQWLCACAVYPELHWDLTLYLGLLPCMAGDLLREESLLRLARLPWFRQGSMPDQLRLLLIRELDPEREEAVRASIVALLEYARPPAGSIAADTHRLDLAIQRWLLRRDRASYREAAKLMREARDPCAFREYALLGFQHARKVSPLQVKLPDGIGKRLFSGRLGGLRTRLAAALAPAQYGPLPDGLKRTLKFGLPSAGATAALFWLTYRFWGRDQSIILAMLLLAAFPIWFLIRRLERALAWRQGEPVRQWPAVPEAAVIAERPARKRARPYVLGFGGLLPAVIFVLGFVGWYLNTRAERTNAMNKFCEARLLAADLVASVAASDEEKQGLRARRRKLEEEYDKYVEGAAWYRDKNPQQRAVLKMARRLGETDLDVPDGFYEGVMQHVARLKSNSELRDAVQRVRSRDLLRMIRVQLAQRDLPEELLFIALQESSFNNQAVAPPSRFGIAKGMWQLIPTTAQQYGLVVGPLKDSPVFDPLDQRHDEILSTKAAVAYLAYLYSTKAVGSALLVVALYSHGVSRVAKNVDELPSSPELRSYWSFSRNGWIPADKQNYVSTILAAALICNDPGLFGYDLGPSSSVNLADMERRADERYREGNYKETQILLDLLLASEPRNTYALSLRQRVAAAGKLSEAYEAALSGRDYEAALWNLARLEELNPADASLADKRVRVESRRANASAVLSIFSLGVPGTLLLDDRPIGAKGEADKVSIPAGRRKMSVSRGGAKNEITRQFLDGESAVYVYDLATMELRPYSPGDEPRIARAKRVLAGAIWGTVVDRSTGKRLPKVEIVLVNQKTGVPSRQVTDQRGEYYFDLVPPGVFEISASLDGYAPAKVQNFSVESRAINSPVPAIALDPLPPPKR